MSCNDKGFTLVEIMVAVVILAIGLLGLFQTVYSTIGYNMQNSLRAEAVAMADEVIAREVAKPFGSVSTSQAQTWSRAGVQGRSINNGFVLWNFSSVRTHVYVSPSSTNVQVRIGWRYKGNQYSQNVASIVSK